MSQHGLRGRRVQCFYDFLAARFVSHTHQNQDWVFYKCANSVEEKRCLFWVCEDDANARSISKILRFLIPPSIQEEASANNQTGVEELHPSIENSGKCNYINDLQHQMDALLKTCDDRW